LLGGCATGDAKVTRGHRLRAGHVIHAVGPVWRGGQDGEPAQLASCYRRALELAAERGFETIAFPAISCGAYGFPIQHACTIAFREIRQFLARSSMPRQVTLVAFDASMLDVYRAVMEHPVARLIRESLDGLFPDPSGGWSCVWPWRSGLAGIISATGYAVLALEEDALPMDRQVALGVNGYGGAIHPSVLLELAGSGGWIDSLGVLLAIRARPAPSPLVERPDLLDHPRVAFARELRDEVRAFGRTDTTSRSVATLGRGIGGLLEMSIELAEKERGRGAGRDFIEAALGAAPSGEIVVAAVAPGNAASLRCFLSAGFQIIGSSQLVRPAPAAIGR
jgi:hypothetical protein